MTNTPHKVHRDIKSLRILSVKHMAALRDNEVAEEAAMLLNEIHEYEKR